MGIYIPLQSNFSLRLGESRLLEWVLTNSDGSQTQLAGLSFQLIAFTPGQTPTAIWGIDNSLFRVKQYPPNVLTVQLPTEATSVLRVSSYGVWDITNNRVLAFGSIAVDNAVKTA